MRGWISPILVSIWSSSGIDWRFTKWLKAEKCLPSGSFVRQKHKFHDLKYLSYSQPRYSSTRSVKAHETSRHEKIIYEFYHVPCTLKTGLYKNYNIYRYTQSAKNENALDIFIFILHWHDVLFPACLHNTIPLKFYKQFSVCPRHI